jgi:uncharacterized protein (TIGR02266 family)
VARVNDRRTKERRHKERRVERKETSPERRAGIERRTSERRQIPRRQESRLMATLRVDYRSEDTFLFAYATNVSSLGIFIHTTNPSPPGTVIELDFGPEEGGAPFLVRGQVVWVNPFRPGGANPNPGMGIRFIEMDTARRERLLRLVRRIAYLGETTPGQA